MGPHSFSVYDLLERNAQTYGARTGLITEAGERRDFRELRRRVDSLAGGLAAAGLAKGDRVVVLAQNSAAYFELYFAAARQGVVLYPLNWRLSADEVAGSLERADARGLVIDAQYHATIPDAIAEKIAFKAQFDGTPPPGWHAVDSLYRGGVELARADLAPDDPFAIISTAAVDVIPRGAILTHANILVANLQSIGAMRLAETDGNLVFLPLFHVAALSGSLAVMHAGGQNVMMTSFDGAAAVKLIDEHGLTFIGDFPPILSTILDEAKAVGSGLPSLKHVSGLENAATIERLHQETQADFWTGFGQTETSGFVTIQRARDRIGSAGKPMFATRLKLVDDFDEEVPEGAAGEILVRGPTVFQGYFAQADITEHTFRNGWHHTGDVGRFDDEGNLYYVKRKPEKELIKPGGENVYPAEVERVILELEGISGVCVFGVSDKRWGEAVAAVVEAPADRYSAQAITDHVGARIARFKRPYHVGFVEVLPRDDTGGIDREAVKGEWVARFES